MAQAPSVPAYDHDDPIGLIKHLRAIEIAAGRPDPFPTPSPLLCVHISCKELGIKGKCCGKCLVAGYHSLECPREDWPAHKA